jgi:T5SS/PEP-CTERM-associated repeat protein
MVGRMIHFALSIVALAAAAPDAAAQVVYVDGDASAGGDGMSWATAFNDLQSGLDAAEAMIPPVQVWVAAGTYLPTLESLPGDPRSRTFRLIEGVSLFGGFAGVGAPDPDARDFHLYPAVLSGDFNGDDQPNFVNRGENAYTVITAQGLTQATALDGLTVRGAHQGSCITVPFGSLLIENCLITDGDATGTHGGGLYAPAGVTVRRTSFTGCKSSFSGGGSYCLDSTFQWCRFELNTASGGGGGLAGLRTSVENSVFRANTAVLGGAVDLGSGRLVNCTFDHNVATSSGAVRLYAFSGLTAGIYGCTFFENTATTVAGALLTVSDPGGLLEVANSIFWADTAPAGPEIRHNGSTTLVCRNSCIGGGTGGIDGSGQVDLADIIDTDPLFVDASASDFRLQASSPLIDRGHNDFTGLDVNDVDLDGSTDEPFPRDLDDLERRMDVEGVVDQGDEGAAGCGVVVDIGAYEMPDISGPGGEFCWAGPATSLFHLGASWLGGVAPGARDVATFDSLGESTAIFGMDAVTRELHVNRGTAALEIGAQTYESGAVRVGHDPEWPAEVAVRSGTLESADAILGDAAGATGKATVEGAGTQWTLTSEVRVGLTGPGFADVLDGGDLFCENLLVGDDLTGATGDVLARGEGARLRAAFTLTVEKGTLRVEDGATVQAGSPFFTGLFVEGGLLAGNSLVDAGVVNFGSVEPGTIADPTGTLAVDGDYVQQGEITGLGPRSGALRVEIGGTDPGADHDVLAVTGDATLAGGLFVSTIGGFEPADADVFTVLTAGSLAGNFDVAFLPAFGTSRFLRVTYGAGAGPSGGEVVLLVEDLDQLLMIGDPTEVAISGVPSSVLVADLDADGDEDLAITLRGGTPTQNGSVIVLRNDGMGGLEEQAQQFTVGAEPADIAAGRLDSGTTLDLAIANSGGDSVSLLFGAGDGTFGPAVTIANVALAPLGVAVANLDGAGLDDLAITSSADDTVRIRLNQGGGSFPVEHASLPVGERPGLIDPPDLDDDKDIDLIVTNLDGGASSDGSVTLLRSQLADGGGFAFEDEEIAVGATPVDLDVRDLDADGHVDVVTSNSGDGTVSVLVSDDVTGALAAAVHFPAGAGAASLATGDLDADGDVDLAVLTGDVVQILRNDLNGGSGEQLAFTLQEDPIEAPGALLLASGDLNGDGVDDLLTINDDAGGASPIGPPAGSVTLLLAIAPVDPCPADVDDSGDVGFADLLAVLATWGPCAGCAADVDGDGTVGFLDLLMVLAAWGPCT